MKALLFNIHDIILLLTIGTFALLTALSLTRASRSTPANSVWASFYIINALLSGYILIYWSDAVREQLFNVFSYAYLVSSTLCFLIGPSLLAIVRACSSNGLQLRWQQASHLIPAFLAIAYRYAVCFRFNLSTQRELFLYLKLYTQPGVYYHYFVSLQKIMPLLYGFVCVAILARARPPMVEDQHLAKTLKMLVIGFTLVWSWELCTHFIGRAYVNGTSDAMGIAANYLKFALALLLVADQLSQRQTATATAASSSTLEPAAIEDAHVELIESAMLVQKAYLDSQITLERFAEAVNLSPREVSTVINRKFQQNFHEFINRYRVETAKKLLSDPNNTHLTITEISQAAGFNSKATFNRFFKKFVLCTPSAFRIKHQKLPTKSAKV